MAKVKAPEKKIESKSEATKVESEMKKESKLTQEIKVEPKPKEPKPESEAPKLIKKEPVLEVSDKEAAQHIIAQIHNQDGEDLIKSFISGESMLDESW